MSSTRRRRGGLREPERVKGLALPTSTSRAAAASSVVPGVRARKLARCPEARRGRAVGDDLEVDEPSWREPLERTEVTPAKSPAVARRLALAGALAVELPVAERLRGHAGDWRVQPQAWTGWPRGAGTCRAGCSSTSEGSLMAFGLPSRLGVPGLAVVVPPAGISRWRSPVARASGEDRGDSCEVTCSRSPAGASRGL